ncbi:MAG TPA: PEP/pyruvate-binding domain-containing protein, partial [Longimicrobiales bacterium]|nr:PEP/pyruvate-binding domain-containing protein [Longimicrobiales bacterium]
TDACSIRVNPAHKQNLRVHLELIGANPSAASKLLATLTARLKAGGVFIADTDMLQRDVSRLLGRQIGPVYHHAKQLLRLLPVYFNDIGAEGELRRVSTRFDELEARTDPLCHFLRKQSHVESNPFLTRVLEHVARYWATGDATALRSCVPASVYDALPSLWREQEGLHEIMRTVADRAEDPAHILDLGVENAVRAIGDLAATHPVAAEKVELLFRFYRELERKYCLDHEDLLERLSGSSAISAGALSRLERALAQGSSDLALEELLGTLERLQEIVLSVGPPEAIEDIYLKRHIAAGIPSMYGSYRERRLEALGLTYRIESLASALLARRIEGLRLSGVSLLELEEVLGCLRLLRRALRIDGFKTGRIDAALSMLGEALAAGIDRTGQYLDIFHLLSRGLEEIVERDFLDFYEGVYTRVLAELESRPGHERSEATQPLSGVDSSEAFLRSLLTEAFGLGLADGLCTRVIHALNTRGIGALDVPVAGEAHRRLVADWTVPIGEGRASSVVRLGNKGANLGTLARHGLPVPPGFIITTDLCNCGVRWDDHRAWSEGVVATIRSRLAELETSTGERLGDPDRPLLLSVRGGAPISMPGMLDSFLNVGLNPSLADRIALTRSRPWATWDAYRRFVQLWGMSHGVARDAFDRLIQREKSVSGVGKKAQLPAERMRRLALEYRALVLDHGIAVVDDPFDQLLHCVGLVLASWGADKARLYRRELHVSEAWGTGVVIQGMVFGNLDASSGTGVVLTRASVHEPGKIRLFGDFVVQGQGDDVVSGLVETLPITERQRQERRRPADGSLEQDFPDVYRALLGHATRMVCDLDMP